MSINRRRNHSTRKFNALIDHLEARVLLTGNIQAGALIDNYQPGSVIRAEWQGVGFEAKQGQWVLHFNDALGNDLARTTALAVPT